MGKTMTTPYAATKLLLLIPFVVLVLVYFAMYHPDPQSPSDTVVALLLKTGPIFYLVVYVVFLGLHFYHHYHEDNKLEDPETSLLLLIEITSVGLLMSSLGDISLVVDLFYLGMLFFGMAHVVRIIGLSSLLKRSWGFGSTLGFILFLLGSLRELNCSRLQEAWEEIPKGKRVLHHAMFLLAVLAAVVVLVVLLVVASPDVLLYFLLLLGMAALQVFSCWTSPTQSAKLGAAGGIAFVLSDSLLGISAVKRTHNPLVMILYYLAQCALAASAVWPPFPGSA